MCVWCVHEQVGYITRVYHHISNAMQYSNTAVHTIALVMCDPDTFFFIWCHFFLWLCGSHKHTSDG